MRITVKHSVSKDLFSVDIHDQVILGVRIRPNQEQPSDSTTVCAVSLSLMFCHWRLLCTRFLVTTFYHHLVAWQCAFRSLVRSVKRKYNAACCTALETDLERQMPFIMYWMVIIVAKVLKCLAEKFLLGNKNFQCNFLYFDTLDLKCLWGCCHDNYNLNNRRSSLKLVIFI